MIPDADAGINLGGVTGVLAAEGRTAENWISLSARTSAAAAHVGAV